MKPWWFNDISFCFRKHSNHCSPCFTGDFDHYSCNWTLSLQKETKVSNFILIYETKKKKSLKYLHLSDIQRITLWETHNKWPKTCFWRQWISYILLLAGTAMSVVPTCVPHAVDKKFLFLPTLLNPDKTVWVLITLSRDLEKLTELRYFVETMYSNLAQEAKFHHWLSRKYFVLLNLAALELIMTLRTCVWLFDFGHSFQGHVWWAGEAGECFCCMRHLRELLPFTCSKNIMLMEVQI